MREGLEETFTANCFGLPASLRRYLASTNIVESLTSGVRLHTRRVTHRQSGETVLRWAAAGLLETENGFRAIIGYKDLAVLRTVLDEDTISPQQVRAA